MKTRIEELEEQRDALAAALARVILACGLTWGAIDGVNVDDIKSALAVRDARLKQEGAELRAVLVAALEPFAEFGGQMLAEYTSLGAHGSGALREDDFSYMQERIKDWFGVSDFRNACIAVNKAKDQS